MNEANFPVIPGYAITSELGSGGMATVYRGHQEKLNRPVAVKVLAPVLLADKTFAARFLKEAQTAAGLSHSNIVSVYDVGQEGNHLYIVMEYLSPSLKAFVHSGRCRPEDALKVLREIGSALHYAHGKGFIHRDIKPDNIMFREDGTAVLTDFGIAKAVGSSTKMTKTGMSIGTPHYMSPEQARGRELDGRSDLYSLGIVFYEMLTGKLPFDAEDSIAIAVKHIQEPIPELPAPLSRHQPLLNRLLAKDPQDRFQSGAELVAVLNNPQGRAEASPAPTPNRVSPNHESRITNHDSPRRPTPTPKPKTGPRTRLVDQSDGGSPLGAGFMPDGVLASARKRNIAIGLGGMVSILLAILVGVLISDNAKKQDSEAWNQARRENTVLSYRSYLSSHPDGQYVGLAREEQSQLEEAARREEQRRQQAARELAAQQERARQEEEKRKEAVRQAEIRREAQALAAERQRQEEEAERRAEAQRLAREQAVARAAAEEKARSGSIEMVRIPGGSFQMGSNSSDSYEDEKPVHSVTVSTFYMSKTEVTQGQWKAVMGNNPSGSRIGDNYPVENVSWNNAQEFIRKLNQQSGKRYRLPTEAEWEYAARSGSSGDRYGNLDSIAWYDGNSGGSTRPVAQKQANAYGLYDMLGNVWEWCSDWYGRYSASSQDNPTGPSSGSHRVNRGGSWNYGALICRAPFRFWFSPVLRSPPWASAWPQSRYRLKASAVTSDG